MNINNSSHLQPEPYYPDNYWTVDPLDLCVNTDPATADINLQDDFNFFNEESWAQPNNSISNGKSKTSFDPLNFELNPTQPVYAPPVADVPNLLLPTMQPVQNLPESSQPRKEYNLRSRQVPQRADASTRTIRMPSLYAPYKDIFGSTEKASQYIHRVRRKPFIDPRHDPTIATIASNPAAHVRKIYECLVDQSSIRDNPSAKVLRRFNGSQNSYPPAELVARAYKLLDALLVAVQVGWMDDVTQDLAGKSRFSNDRRASCALRFHNVCQALRLEKQVALDVMNGDVARLVNAPLEYAAIKARNRACNMGKASVLKRAKDLNVGGRKTGGEEDGGFGVDGLSSGFGDHAGDGIF